METDGLKSYKLCRKCDYARYKAWCVKNKEKIAKYYEVYYIKNKEKLREYNNRWKQEKRDKANLVKGKTE